MLISDLSSLQKTSFYTSQWQIKGEGFLKWALQQCEISYLQRERFAIDPVFASFGVGGSPMKVKLEKLKCVSQVSPISGHRTSFLQTELDYK